MRNSYLINYKKIVLAALFLCGYGHASVSDYAASPPLLSDSTTPMIMLAMPNDHQLYYKAYTDWDDLDADGIVETTYTHSIDYAGYFDSYKCYTYASGVFSPVSISSTKYCNVSPATGQWSGNFLNWASMTRMDEIRKVLYGGYRSTDTSSRTVLERAFLPNDAHSFAKYYDGNDLYSLTAFTSTSQPVKNTGASVSGITICNTTDASRASGQPANSASVDDPPLMKIVKGNYALWAASERFQCTYNDDSRMGGDMGENGNSPSSLLRAYGDSPASSEEIYSLNVRVEVCNSSLIGKEECKEYPDGNYKPIGLLQEFGDDDSVYFGLFSGSYKKNKDGGVLRKNIGTISNEINVATDGTFTGAGGIIKTLDIFRIAGYEYWNNTDNRSGTYREYDDCTWGLNSFSNGDCSNWGNPFAEIMLECYRYYAGNSANSTFAASDSSVLTGLSTEASVDPLNSDNACAKLNLIAFNASTISYDRDNLSLFSDLNPGSATAQTATKLVGDGEGITGKSYFVGESGGAGNQLCTAKTVNDLGSVEGTCPDAPRLDGSYMAAGLAHHAHVNDIRADLDGDQLVNTYGVSLSPALPQIKIPIPGATGRTVTILPACYNDDVGGTCGLVDFKVLRLNELAAAGTYTGTFYVNWEDSEQGGDYDQDMSGLLTYTITSTTIVVSTKMVGKSTPNEMAFGYILSGTTDDGFHAQSGINGYSGFDCSNCKVSDSSASETYYIGLSTADLLEQPLYYAAKWGGFVDEGTVDATLGEPIPNLQTEWDVIINSTGAYGQDGIPDNYFFAVNPAELKSQLELVVRNILARTASGTAAAVVTTTGAGEGAIYQASYNPRFDSDSGSGNQNITWVGNLHALFLDRYGELREDVVATGEQIGTLNSNDPIVEIYYDSTLKETMIQRYSTGADGKRGIAQGAPVTIDNLNPIWDARGQLAALTNLTANRTSYSSLASAGRYILTGIDADESGWVDSNELFSFEADTFDRTTTEYFRLLGFSDANSDTDVENLVNFIRGDETIGGFRKRTINYDGNALNGDEPWILGDIVNSTPKVLSKPSKGYDITYNDLTYKAFRNAKAERRQVVFVGANDGMLHAFNGGFYDAATSSYVTSKNAEIAHPLGSELWAYVPYNLLPHLNYLASPSYPHVFYMDGESELFDINITHASASSAPPAPNQTAIDAAHWKTILIAGMRFGGGEITVDPDSDIDGDTSDDLAMRSAYVILDVTDPELPPSMIGEITSPDLGYTISRPTLVKYRQANTNSGNFSSPAVNSWYLIFGSGPAGTDSTSRKTALDHAVSNKTAKVYAYNINTGSLQVFDTGVSSAFVGGFNSADWNNDYKDDAVYFGIVGGSEAAPTGRLMRGAINWSTAGAITGISFSSLLSETSKPFSATPTVNRDRTGDFWVYGGTGRLYTDGDVMSSTLQSFYGVKDPDAGMVSTNSTVSTSDLVDTTGITVYASGRAEKAGSTPFTLHGSAVASFKDIKELVADNSGWRFDFANARQRNTTKSALASQSLVITSYQPTGKICDLNGTGYLHIPHMQAGVPGPYLPSDVDPATTNLDTYVINSEITLGIGNFSEPVIYQDSEGNDIAAVQGEHQELITEEVPGELAKGHRQSWREIPITW